MFNPKNPNEKLYYETISVEYCEVQAKILINQSMELRQKNTDVDLNYLNSLDEACKLLIFAKLKYREMRINGASQT